MICARSAAERPRGSASLPSAVRSASRLAMFASSEIATTIDSRPSSLLPSENFFTLFGAAAARASKYLLRSATYESLPRVPGTYPSTLSGVGTVAEAGREETSSVLNFQCESVGVSSVIWREYAESTGCWATRASLKHGTAAAASRKGAAAAARESLLDGIGSFWTGVRQVR